MRKRTLGVLLSLLFLAAPVAAQEQRGGLEGTVKDNTGAVLPGCDRRSHKPHGDRRAVGRDRRERACIGSPRCRPATTR